MTTAEEARLDALTEQQDDEVFSAEQAAAVAATAALLSELEKITAAAVVLYEAGTDPARLVSQLRARLLGVRVDVARPLLDHFLRSLTLGERQAYAQLGVRMPRRGRDVVPGLPVEVVTAATRAEIVARQEVADGAGLLAGVSELDDVLAALARARRAVTRTEAAATWGVNRAVAAGVTEVAVRERTSRLWVGERDACLHCLAYFGEVAGPEAPFPSGLTFAAKPLNVAVPSPPLHPNCRCRIALWRGEWASGDGGYPEALKREARRSVARGWSLESESNRARLDAAERLLRRGAGLPKTVEEYAARAVRAGRFPRGRRFPD